MGSHTKTFTLAMKLSILILIVIGCDNLYSQGIDVRDVPASDSIANINDGTKIEPDESVGACLSGLVQNVMAKILEVMQILRYLCSNYKSDRANDELNHSHFDEDIMSLDLDETETTTTTTTTTTTKIVTVLNATYAPALEVPKWMER